MREYFNKYVYGFIGLALIALVLLSINSYQVNKSKTRRPPKYLKEITKLTNLNFPPSVQWINYNLDRGMDYFWEAKFLIPKKDIRKVFGDIKGEWKTNERFLINNLHSGKNWFNPDSIKSFKSIKVRYPQGHTGTCPIHSWRLKKAMATPA